MIQPSTFSGRVLHTFNVLRAGWRALTKGTNFDVGLEAVGLGAPSSGWRWLGTPSDQSLLNGYKFGPWPHIKFMRLCSSLAMLEFEVYTRDARTGKDTPLRDDYPLAALLDNPNPILTGWDFRFICELYLRAMGEVGIWAPRNTFNRPMAFYPMPRYWVRPERDPQTGRIVRYAVPFTSMGSMMGQMKTIPAEEMIWLRLPDPHDPYTNGLGDMLALATEIETFEYASESDRNFFLRDATPHGYIEVPSMTPMSKPDRDALRDDWRRTYGGFMNAGEVPVLWGGMKFNLLRQNRKDMDFIEGQQFLRDTIIAGVHPHILGIAEDVNRANAEAADYTYSKHEILPRARWWEAAINKWMAPMWDARVRFRFLRVVPEDVERILLAAKDPIIAETLTVRQRLQLLDRAIGNVEPEETDTEYLDQYVMTANRIPFSADAPPEPAAPASTPAGGQPPQDPAAGDDGGKRLMEAKRAIPALPTGKEVPPRRVTVGDLAVVVGSVEQAAEDLFRHLRPAYLAVLEARWTDAMDEVGLGIAFDLADPAISTFMAEAGGVKIRGITDTLRADIMSALQEGVQAGEGIPNLARRVGEVFDAAKGGRATTIARTETLQASNAAAYQAYALAKVDKVEWLLAPDYKPEDDGGECEPFDGKVVPLGTSFAPGVDYPPLHPNCRCTIAPIFVDTAGEERSMYQGEAREKRRTALGAAHARLERTMLMAVKRGFQAYQNAILRRLRQQGTAAA